MVVTCPKCSIKLKVDETKLSPAGSKFKCPKCAAVLIVKKPAAQTIQALKSNTVLAGHSNPALLQEIVSALSAAGYRVVTAADGIDLMVKAIKEFPFLAIIEVALPKIYGFEVCRRLKARPDTKEMKFILIPAIHDKTKYRREPSSLYGADEYIEEFDLKSQLVEKVSILKAGGAVPSPAAQEKTVTADKPSSPVEPPKLSASEPGQKSALAQTAPNVQPQGAAQPGNDEKVEKAKRLARTIINDIHLYNTAKVDTAIKTGDFYSVFAPELKEGKKLYDSRIPQEIREKFDHYREAIENFIASKKSS